MYSTCISCNAHLGRNQVLEAFPVGRRLAFDPHRGRLWVLCSACRSWNLAPIEERWEAVEAAERLFASAALGASTENVALGRVAEGTELLRIGHADRREVAEWRYTDRLLGRWRKHRRRLEIGLVGVGVVTVLSAPGSVAVFAGLYALHLRQKWRPIVRTGDGRIIRAGTADRALLVPADTAEGWSLSLPRRRAAPLLLEGPDAVRALRGFLPRLNLVEGSPEQLRDAVAEVDRLGSATTLLQEAARDLTLGRRYRWIGGRRHRLVTGHPVIRLALEMAINEETEKRALEGEVALLEWEWKEAEELAAISDDLLVPRHLRERLLTWKESPPHAPSARDAPRE